MIRKTGRRLSHTLASCGGMLLIGFINAVNEHPRVWWQVVAMAGAWIGFVVAEVYVIGREDAS